MSIGAAAVCITCGTAALFRSSVGIPPLILRYKASYRNDPFSHHLVDESGFSCCEGDTVVLTICWSCERRRAQQYGLVLRTEVRESNSRLTNPNLAKAFIERSLVMSNLWELMRGQVLLGPNPAARPVLKIELLGYLLQMGRSTAYEYVGSINPGERAPVDRRALFFNTSNG